MRNIKGRICLSLAMLALTNLSYAGIAEKSWNFSKGETVIKVYKDTPDGSGAEFGCDLFSPSEVSFKIKYEYLNNNRFPISVVADKKEKVVDDEFNRIITVTKANSLSIGIPNNSKVKITNTTGTSVIGSNCGSGFYG